MASTMSTSPLTWETNITADDFNLDTQTWRTAVYDPQAEAAVLKERIRVLEEKMIKMEEEFADQVAALVKALSKEGFGG